MTTSSDVVALLVEYLPDVHFKTSTQGCLLIILSTGSCYLFPLNEESSGKTDDTTTVLSSVAITNNSALTDILLKLDQSFLIHEFIFHRCVGSSSRRVTVMPHKLVLSADKSLLMINGCYLTESDTSRFLLVYQIIESFPDPLYLIYKDLSLSVNDCCFNPNSKSLIVIPHNHPTYLFLIDLPLIQCKYPEVSMLVAHTSACGAISRTHQQDETVAVTPPPSSNDNDLPKPKSLFLNATTKKNVEHHIHHSGQSGHQGAILMEPRSIGVLAILGPITDCYNQPFIQTSIQANFFCYADSYHYISWNKASERGPCQYILWNITLDVSKGNYSYSCHPRLLNPSVVDRQWLTHPASPTTQILDACFNSSENGKLMLAVERRGWGRGSDNGIGIQTTDVYPVAAVPEGSDTSGETQQQVDVLSPWYHVCDSPVDNRPVLSCKWTKTLLLGTHYSAALMVQSKGLFELVDHHCASSFQALNDSFVASCSNFVQVGRYSRYWVTCEGHLRAFIVSPQQPAKHPEWDDLVKLPNNEVLPLRVLGRRIGYFIQDLEKEASSVTLDSLYSARKKAGGRRTKGKKKGSSKAKTKTESETFNITLANHGIIEAYMGHHLYTCALCQLILMKPLICSNCDNCAYCSPACQALHWHQHKADCK